MIFQWGDIKAGWWFGTFLFFHILGISSSQLTLTFFRGVGIPPTRNNHEHPIPRRRVFFIVPTLKWRKSFGAIIAPCPSTVWFSRTFKVHEQWGMAGEMVSFAIQHDDFPYFCQRLPEGTLRYARLEMEHRIDRCPALVCLNIQLDTKNDISPSLSLSLYAYDIYIYIHIWITHKYI